MTTEPAGHSVVERSVIERIITGSMERPLVAVLVLIPAAVIGAFALLELPREGRRATLYRFGWSGRLRIHAPVIHPLHALRQTRNPMRNRLVSRVRFGPFEPEPPQNAAQLLLLQWRAHCFVPISRRL